MSTLFQDLHYGFRMLAKAPGFTAVAVIALALGIGANTAMFSVVNAVLLQPLPYRDANRLVTFWSPSWGPAPVCDPDYVQWRSQNQVFDGIAAFHGQPSNLTGSGNPARLDGAVVTASLFPLLGVKPALGRAFLPEEEQAGRGNVVLLSHKLWEQRFGSDPAILSKTITLDDKSFTVVGVLPAGFDFPNQAAFWSPLVLNADCHNAFDQVVARLRPGVTLERARNDVAVIGHRLNQEEHREDDQSITVVFLKDEMVSNIRPALLILLGAVGLVLLIACANVANLLLARATSRQREIAIRKALGAGRMRIIRQMLTESVLLAALGGGLGLALAVWGRDTLVSLLPPNLAQPGVINRIASVNLDAWVLGFALVVSLVTGLLFGLAPALQASRLDTHSSLKESGSTYTAAARVRSLRSVLVISEFALTLVLLVGAGLLIRSFVRLLEVNPGFQPQRVLTMSLALPETKYQTEAQMKGFHDSLLERIGSLPGVRAAGTVSFGLPLGNGGLAGDFTIEGQAVRPRGQWASKFVISPDYFRALGMPLVQGRSFGDGDTERAPRVVVVSETFARRFWPSGQALGKRIDIGFSGAPWRSVVGVVGDVKQHGLGAEAPLALYLPYSQSPGTFLLSFMTLVVRTVSDPMSMTNAVRREVQGVDPEMPVFDVASMEELVYKSMSEPRFNTLLLGCFAALALILATVGIYGVISYSVTQRTHEIGVRLALGAAQRDVLRLVVGQGMVLTLIGVAIGVAAALALTRVLSTFLYGVRPTDPATFLLVSSVLGGVALAASYIPARRATKVDPVVALRYE